MTGACHAPVIFGVPFFARELVKIAARYGIKVHYEHNLVAVDGLPLNPAKEHWVGWWIKVTGLPLMYWNYMMKGYVWFPKHNTAFKGDVV
jgi:hypothetical protein